MIFFLVTIVLGAIGYFVYQNYFNKGGSGVANNSEVNDNTDKVVVETSENRDELRFKNAVKSLLNTNIYVRMNINDIELRSHIEKLIDDIREIIEPINDKKNFSSLSMTVNTIGEDYLPRILEPYVALTENERQNNRDNLIANIDAMSTELASIRAELENDNIDSFGRFNDQLNVLFQKHADVGDALV